MITLHNERLRCGLIAFAGLLVLAVSVLLQAETAAQDDGDNHADPDTTNWKCEDCPYRYGLIGSILVGTGYVSDDYFDFGNYRGLENGGVYGALGVDLLYRDDEARYLDVYGDRLGLDSRSLSIEGGRQGRYTVGLEYDEIPMLRAQGSRTIFVGAGSASQQLPEGWIRGGTTGEMDLLDGSLRPVDVEVQRKTLRLGLEFKRESPWRYRAEVERSRKDGGQIKGASFIFRASELLAPVDYTTTKLETGIGYVRKSWQLEGVYQLSRFDNDHRSTRWQNPFLGINDAQLGELAQPPDNSFHQFMLTGSWRAFSWLTLTGQVALGRAEQNETFLDPTLNAALVRPAFPRSDLNGTVATRIINLRATSNLTERLGARVQLRYDERDNGTDSASFVQVVSDTFHAEAREYTPYSYERSSIDAAFDYRIASNLKVTASARHQEMDRNLGESRKTDTNEYSLKLRATPASRLSVQTEVSREERRNDLDPALLAPQVNPDLRRFHFSEKDRDAFSLIANYAFERDLNVSVYGDLSEEDFSDVGIGLSSGRTEGYGLDLSKAISDHVSVHAFIAMEYLEADILGTDNIEGAKWQARQDDRIRTAGIGMEFGRLPGKWLNARVDFNYASADGSIRIDKRDIAPEFPMLKTRRYTLEAYAERMLRENLNLRLGYLLGKLSEDDFFRDDVLPGTSPTLLALGQRPPDGTVHVVNVMLRYRFE